MSATPSAISSKKSSVVRSKTHKPKSVQSAIVARRMNGDSKSKIARDLGIARNTVTSIVELSDVEQQIAEARRGAIDLAPVALKAVRSDLDAGNGALGLKLLNDIGAIGEDALDSIRRHSARQSGAINVLVQAGGTLHIDDTASKHNTTLADTTPICSNVQNNVNNSTDTVNDKVTPGQGAPVGKHPKAAPTHQ